MTTYLAIILTFLLALFGLIFKPDQTEVKKKKTYLVKLSFGGWTILATLLLSSMLTWKISHDELEEKRQKILTDSLNYQEQINSLRTIDTLERLNLANQKTNYENQLKVTEKESEILKLKLETANKKLETVESNLFPVCPIRISYVLSFDISCNEANSFLSELISKAGAAKITTLTSPEIQKVIMESKNDNVHTLFHHAWGDNSLHFYENGKLILPFSHLEIESQTFEIKEVNDKYYLIETVIEKGNCSSREAAGLTLKNLFASDVILSTSYQKNIPECMKPIFRRKDGDVKIKFDNIDAFEITEISEMESPNFSNYRYTFSNWKSRRY